MPVFVNRQMYSSDRLNHQLGEVVADLPTDHHVRCSLNDWIDQKSRHQLWVGVFNGRVVSFALVNQSKLKALAVHHATRQRGVGRRVLSELQRQIPNLILPVEVCDPWLNSQSMKLFKSINDSKK